MPYFYTIVTKKMQDRPEGLAAEHAASLNTYIMTPGANGKRRNVESMNTTQILLFQQIIMTTILCCDEDEDDE